MLYYKGMVLNRLERLTTSTTEVQNGDRLKLTETDVAIIGRSPKDADNIPRADKYFEVRDDEIPASILSRATALLYANHDGDRRIKALGKNRIKVWSTDQRNPVAFYLPTNDELPDAKWDRVGKNFNADIEVGPKILRLTFAGNGYEYRVDINPKEASPKAQEDPSEKAMIEAKEKLKAQLLESIEPNEELQELLITRLLPSSVRVRDVAKEQLRATFLEHVRTGKITGVMAAELLSRIPTPMQGVEASTPVEKQSPQALEVMKELEAATSPNQVKGIVSLILYKDISYRTGIRDITPLYTLYHSAQGKSLQALEQYGLNVVEQMRLQNGEEKGREYLKALKDLEKVLYGDRARARDQLLLLFNEANKH